MNTSNNDSVSFLFSSSIKNSEDISNFNILKICFFEMLEDVFAEKEIDLPGHVLFNRICDEWFTQSESKISYLIKSFNAQEEQQALFVNKQKLLIDDLYEQIGQINQNELNDSELDEFAKIQEIVTTLKQIIDFRISYYAIDEILTKALEELTSQTDELMEDNSQFTAKNFENVLYGLIKLRQEKESRLTHSSHPKLQKEVEEKVRWNTEYALEKVDNFMTELYKQIRADVAENKARRDLDALLLIRSQCKALIYGVQKFSEEFPSVNRYLAELNKIGILTDDVISEGREKGWKPIASNGEILTKEKKARQAQKKYWQSMNNTSPNRELWQFIGKCIFHGWTKLIAPSLELYNARDRREFLLQEKNKFESFKEKMEKMSKGEITFHYNPLGEDSNELIEDVEEGPWKQFAVDQVLPQVKQEYFNQVFSTFEQMSEMSVNYKPTSEQEQVLYHCLKMYQSRNKSQEQYEAHLEQARKLNKYESFVSDFHTYLSEKEPHLDSEVKPLTSGSSVDQEPMTSPAGTIGGLFLSALNYFSRVKDDQLEPTDSILEKVETAKKVLTSSDILDPETAEFAQEQLEDSIEKLSRLKKKVEVSQPGAFEDRKDFSEVKPGDLVFFSHLHQVTHLVIKHAQRIGMFGNPSTYNVTHAGVVTEVNDKKIRIAEISAYGVTLSNDEYDLEKIYNDEQLIIITPDPDSNSQDSAFRADVARNMTEKLPELESKEYNQYNLRGLAEIPLRAVEITDKDKYEIASSLVDYLVFSTAPKVVHNNQLEPKKYFCSEFASEVYQMSRIMSTLSEGDKSALLDKLAKLDHSKEEGRQSSISLLKEELDKLKIWQKLEKDPLMQLSSKAATPSLLLQLAMSKSTAVRVTNPQELAYFKEIPPEGRELLKYTEYLFAKVADAKLNGQELTTDIEEVRKLMEVLTKKFNYSEESLKCFIEVCSKDPSLCQPCLGNALSISEKIAIYFMSREVNRSVRQLLKNENFIELVKNPTISNLDKFDFDDLDLTVDTALDKAYPLDVKHPVDSAENAIARYLARNMQIETLIKYIPLTLAYAPPSRELKEFLDSENLSVLDFALTFQKIVSERSSTPQSQFYAQLTNGVFKTGIIKMFATSELSDPIFKKIEKETGYSPETIKCILKDSSGGNLDPEMVEKCLTDTLTLREMMRVYFASLFANRAVENILENKYFLQFLTSQEFDKNAFVQEYGIDKDNSRNAALQVMFPAEGVYTRLIHSIARSYFASFVNQGRTKEMLVKDIFLGLQFDSPANKIQNFIEKNEISKFDLALNMASFINKLIEK